MRECPWQCLGMDDDTPVYRGDVRAMMFALSDLVVYVKDIRNYLLEGDDGEEGSEEEA